MDTKKTIFERRTIRKYQQKPILRADLTELVEAGRLAPSAANMQPLAYLVVDQQDKVEQMFPLLKWAGYLAPEANPGPDERPVAYIVVLADTQIRKSGYEHDAGAAIENISLLAWSKGIGSCWIGSVDRMNLQSQFALPERYRIDSVIALGYSAEQSVFEDEQGSIKYYKDENQTLHVPKRKTNDIVFYNVPD